MKIIKKYKYLLTIIILLILICYIIKIKKELNNNKCNEIVIEQEVPKIEKQLTEDIKLCHIDIKGAIKNPGVYQVDCTKNVNDIIKISGGLTKNADTSMINLSKKIKDEMVIIIYTKDEVNNSKTVEKIIEKECICPNIKNDGCINTEQSTTDNKNLENNKVNINNATLNELENIPGIGESKAKAIIEYREKNSLFTSIEDLQKVNGIGEKLYEQIKIYITT